ncbi:hypothetical protein [Peribacillus deserti]|uniref:DUF1433 domain-containing protein n=1 Tax=Peribacillus deserti TaxID=673318 RepID=A0A2N5MBM8_9BACI|nr:hypothetical protein [Peribacillus deserti]PLT31754.1 hypothetical protein CUU66_00905 [Peribacillus deserti]
MRKGILLTCTLLIILFITGCRQEGEKSKKEMKELASQVAIEYLKVREGKDFIVDEVEFSDGTGLTDVFVYGHLRGKKDEKMSVLMDYENDFKVASIQKY